VLSSHYLYWLFGANDSSIVGWVNTFLYFYLALRCYEKSSVLKPNSPEKMFWFVMLGVFVILGINKQLDIHKDVIILFVGLVKGSALASHQFGLKLAILAISVSVFIYLVWTIKSFLINLYEECKLLILGLFLLVFYIFERYITFNNFFSRDVQIWAEYFSAPTEFIILLVILVGLLNRYDDHFAN